MNDTIENVYCLFEFGEDARWRLHKTLTEPTHEISDWVRRNAEPGKGRLVLCWTVAYGLALREFRPPTPIPRWMPALFGEGFRRVGEWWWTLFEDGHWVKTTAINEVLRVLNGGKGESIAGTTD